MQVEFWKKANILVFDWSWNLECIRQTHEKVLMWSDVVAHPKRVGRPHESLIFLKSNMIAQWKRHSTLWSARNRNESCGMQSSHFFRTMVVATVLYAGSRQELMEQNTQLLSCSCYCSTRYHSRVVVLVVNRTAGVLSSSRNGLVWDYQVLGETAVAELGEIAVPGSRTWVERSISKKCWHVQESK